MYCSSLSVFMMNNMPSGIKKHRESTEPESLQMDKFKIVTFHDCCCTKEQHFILNSAPPLFHKFEVSWGSSNQLLKNYGFICSTIFFSCTHAHKSLSNWKTIITQGCWIGCVHEDRESLSSIVDLVFEQSLVNDSSVDTAYMYWGSMWGQTCCSVIDGKIELKHAPAAKKRWHKQDYKNIKNVTRCRDSKSAKSRETR